MQLEIRFVGTDKSTSLTQHVQRHVGFALRRFYARVKRLVVRFEDVNGPRGGVDKVCRVEAIGDFGQRIAEARGEDPFSASARALDVIEHSLARALGRRRTVLRTQRTLGARRRIA